MTRNQILENFKSKGEQDAAFEGATQAKIARAEKRQMRGKGVCCAADMRKDCVRAAVLTDLVSFSFFDRHSSFQVPARGPPAHLPPLKLRP